jgi:hypothetical protein
MVKVVLRRVVMAPSRVIVVVVALLRHCGIMSVVWCCRAMVVAWPCRRIIVVCR